MTKITVLPSSPRTMFDIKLGDLNMWGGWTVHVGERVFYAHVSDRADAVNAVRSYLGTNSGEAIEARKPIQSTVFGAMGIGEGAVGVA